MNIKAKFILCLLSSATLLTVLYILFHELGHMIVMLSAGDTIDDFSIIGAHVSGHGGTYLALIVIRRVLGLATLALTIRLGVLQYLFWAVIVSGPVGVLINAIPNWRLLGYSWLKQFLDILPASLMSLVAWGAVFAAECVWPFRVEWFLAVGVPFGFAIYFALALAFRADPLAEFAQQLLKHTGRMPSLGRALAAISRRCGK